ncbi:hypothetical protein ACWD2L_00335 [Streptomyces sp. NPDC002754]
MKPWRPYVPVFCTSMALTAIVVNVGNPLGMAASGLAVAIQPFVWRSDHRAYLARRSRRDRLMNDRMPVDLVDAPRQAWVTLHDGERVDCTIVRTGPREWSATPVRDVAVTDVASACVDQIPAYADVAFALRTSE